MYTKRELPLLLGRVKPVLSSTEPFSKVFGNGAERPATEKTFTLSGAQFGAGLPVIIGVIVLLMFLGRR